MIFDVGQAVRELQSAGRRTTLEPRVWVELVIDRSRQLGNTVDAWLADPGYTLLSPGVEARAQIREALERWRGRITAYQERLDAGDDPSSVATSGLVWGRGAEGTPVPDALWPLSAANQLESLGQAERAAVLGLVRDLRDSIAPPVVLSFARRALAAVAAIAAALILWRSR